MAILSTLVRTHRKQFDALASAWLASGAKGLAVCSEGKRVATWPADHLAQPADLVAPIHDASGQLLGELRLTGQPAAATARLAADATFVASLADLNNDLEGMAAALAETEDQLLALYALTKSTDSRLDVGQLLRSTARQAARLVKAEGAFVLLAPDQIVQMPDALAPTEMLTQLFARLQHGGRELLLTRAEVAGSWPARATNLFLMPLMTDDHGKVTAALGLWLGREAATLSPDLKLARSIAEQGGAQLQIALLHQELVMQARTQAELELARQVQLGLLPKRPPQMPGLELFAESRPALRVGGDFYDFYAGPVSGQDAGYLTFSVGDITGKGMSAALLMAMTRTTLRVVTGAQAIRHTPESILSSANADLYDDFYEVGMMASVFIGQYDATRQVLTYANAGHSPVLFSPAQGDVQLLEADGPFMGVFPTSLSQNQTVSFGQGDVLAVLTDGFNEAQNPHGEFFGIDQLGHLIKQTSVLPAAAMGEALFSEVRRFSEGRLQDDDQTLMIIKGV